MDTKDKQMLWMATTRGILLSGDMIPLQSVAMFLVGKCCRKQFEPALSRLSARLPCPSSGFDKTNFTCHGRGLAAECLLYLSGSSQI